MRPWQAILLIIVLAFLAISSGWDVLYRLTYVLVILFILSWLWARYSLRKLVFRRTAASGRVQVGETFDERLMLDNLAVIPKLWVQIADGSTLPGHRAGYVATMGAASAYPGERVLCAGSAGASSLAPLLLQAAIPLACSGAAPSSQDNVKCWCCHTCYRLVILHSSPADCQAAGVDRGVRYMRRLTLPPFAIISSAMH